MEQNILSFGIFLFALAFHFQTQAQVTISKSDYPRQSNLIDSVRYVEQSGLSNPVEGTDQVWDYSSLQAGVLRTFEFFDASNNPNFPNALN